MIRSALAILAGIAVLTATSFGIEAVADALMMRQFPDIFPNQAAIQHNAFANLFLFLYTAWCVAAGGYVTAWMANRREELHAVIMGAIQLGLTVWAMFSLRDVAPLLNWIVGMLLIVPAAWFGGRMRAKRLREVHAG